MKLIRLKNFYDHMGFVYNNENDDIAINPCYIESIKQCYHYCMNRDDEPFVVCLNMISGKVYSFYFDSTFKSKAFVKFLEKTIKNI